MKVYTSIVLYKTDKETLQKSIEVFLNCKFKEKRLFLIDHSPNDQLKIMADMDESIVYIFNPSNPGFGAGHNIAINKAIEDNADYHLVINPDVSAKGDVISPMVEYMQKDSSIGMMMPQILNEDGSIQYLPKLLPSPYTVLMRKLKRPKCLYDGFINQYELRSVSQSMIYNVPILSGCFTIFNVKALKEIGGYDDRFFMYFEDWDLSRRMNKKYKTLYFPNVSITHNYESGANHNKRLFKIFVQSAIKFFTKWGWIFDCERRKINKQTLAQFKNN